MLAMTCLLDVDSPIASTGLTQAQSCGDRWGRACQFQEKGGWDGAGGGTRGYGVTPHPAARCGARPHTWQLRYRT